MHGNALHIDTILAKDLYTFFCDYAQHAENQQISPISLYRSLSQSKNPCAGEGDIGLLVAYIGDLCVGHFGLIPGWLRTSQGIAKVYWGSAFYILPEFRKRMVAVELIRKTISLRNDIIFTYFNQPTAALLKGLHFQEIPPLEYVLVRLEALDAFAYPFRRFDRLKKRWPVLGRAADLAIRFSRRWSYPPIRGAYHRNLARRTDLAIGNVNWREIPDGKLPSTGDCDVPPPGANFQRDAETINWMVELPWIRDGGAVTRPPYFFGESYDLFRYFTLVIDDTEGRQRGFIVLSRSVDKGVSKLKVLDFRCRQEDCADVFSLICKYAAQFDVDEIELPLQFESQATRLPFASFVVRRQRRRYLCHPYSKDSPLSRALPALNLALTDGDYPFT